VINLIPKLTAPVQFDCLGSGIEGDSDLNIITFGIVSCYATGWIAVGAQAYGLCRSHSDH
jgi:hypothetical protein